MHVFEGTLLVEEIRGRKGVFCVGTLQTSIGDFKVKDAELDQYKAGAYHGSFAVERIFTKGVPWKGGFFTELIAKIAPDGFLIHDEGSEPTELVPSTQSEPDPVDEPLTNTTAAQAPDLPIKQARQPKATVAPVVFDEVATTDDSDLFGVELSGLFAQRAPVIELDPTVDREQFRRQRDRLKAGGYRFDSKSQRWHLATNSN